MQVYGSMKYAVRIQLDPQQLAARSIGIDEVARSVENGNVNLPTGILWGTDKAYAVESQGQLENAADFGALIVAFRDGAPVHLRDLGRVVDSVQDTKRASWFNGERAVVLAIQRQPGTNTVAVAERVKAEVESLQGQIPASVDIATLNDRSVSVKASVEDVKFTLYLALCLVVMVIFLFLRNLRATAIPSLALPMSIVATFAVMYLLGYSLDNMSLMALTLAVGFVVDDAIVVLENIVRHIERGEPVLAGGDQGEPGDHLHGDLDDHLAGRRVHPGALPRRAHRPAVRGVRGDHRRGDPGLGLRLAHPHPDAVQPVAQAAHASRSGTVGSISRSSAPGITSLRWYERSLGWVMRHRRTAMAFSALILVGTVVLVRVVPKGFIPSEDTGQL